MTDTTEKPGPIWVDADEYCRRTLLGGAPIPWADSGELASFVSRSAALTRTDAVLIDLGAAWSSRLADPVVLDLVGPEPLEGVYVNLMTAVSTMDKPAVKKANELLAKYYPNTKPGYYPYLGMAGGIIIDGADTVTLMRQTEP